ncbi:uncharacterized protein MELLADRAFT_61240 [Melampsora larici-populina 98AG31]|uniref:CxC1-like cysteine cluster associated with KDZ transposases domain-containing protein n=1 Tax=Melampsora larici-populina (strain 98AG31 / pathotype 3-4-7) TaxID=747676 RepID=F4RE54_MELLP|nr:uncharacterized protein MELLADRAFT_61240 [Melampsora larici-populina 98AG31]EGG09031.1 hypothetical protein MELLADRAFT_61240 [Melampsora larici-populina 98AG31]
MPRPKKQLCSNHSNEPDQPPRRRVKKRDAEAEQQFQKEVKQGAQFLNGILPKDQNKRIPLPPPIPNNENEAPHDNLYDHYMPIILPAIEGEQREVNAPGGVEVNDLIARFVAQQREYRYARRQEELQQHWDGLENQLTAAYLQCQTRTSNWTVKSSYLEDVSDVCECTADRFAAKAVQFCRCLPEPVQLVYKGYVPASPKKPRTAFSIPLLQMYHFVWQTSVAAASSFFEGMMNFHDSRVRKPLRGRGAPGN